MSTTWRLSHRPHREAISAKTIFIIGALLWLVTAAAGVLGLLDSRPEHHGWLNASAAFGVLLCVSVTVRFVLQVRAGQFTSLGVHALVRRQSREVYLVLYLLAAIRVMQYLTDGAVTSLAIRIGSFRAQSAPYISMERSMEGLQGYLASGMIVLAALRIAAALYLARRQMRGRAARFARPRARY
jgi:cytochrome b561